MSERAGPTPTEVRAPSGARVMEVRFSDGHEGYYPHAILRGFCPCAQCQGHQGRITYVEPKDLEIRDLAEVGNYALRILWGDGHGTGIYSFSYLRELCACSQCVGDADPTARTFGR